MCFASDAEVTSGRGGRRSKAAAAAPRRVCTAVVAATARACSAQRAGRAKRTIVFVSHDLDEAFKIGNRIAIMEGGRIVQCGTPQEIFTHPENDYVADFVAHMNPLGVLCARDVMEPAQGRPRETVPPGTEIQAVMERVKATGHPVGVEENGQLLGQITRDTVLAKLLDPRGG